MKKIFSICCALLMAVTAMAESADWYLYFWSEATGGFEQQFEKTDDANIIKIYNYNLTVEGINFCVRSSDWNTKYGWKDASVTATGTPVGLASTDGATGWCALPTGTYNVTFNLSDLTIQFDTPSTPPTPTVARVSGGDISLVPAYEAAGDKWLNAKGEEITDMVTYLRDVAGWNAIRCRLFVNPQQKGNDGSYDPSVCQNLDYVKALGKRVKDAGMKFLLDLQYSDTYVDATHIQAPEAWKGLSAAEMATKVGSYTEETLQTLIDAGAQPDYVQVGNEVMYGMCGIQVHPYDYSGDDWTGFLDLLKAGTEAVRAKCPDAKIVIHTDHPEKAAYTQYYYNKLATASIDYDVIGFSYYPFWHGKVDNLKTNLSTYAETYSTKEIQIVESAYFCRSHEINSKETDMSGTWAFNGQGQAMFVADLVNALKENDKVTGFYYWMPEECGNGSDGTTNKVLESWQNRGLWEQSWLSGSHRLAAEQALLNIGSFASATDAPQTPTFIDITNAGFETNDMTGWTIDNWSMIGSNTGQYWPKAYDSSHWEKCYGGSYYLSMWGDGTTGSEGLIAYQTVTAPAKGYYTVNADVYSESDDLSLYISNGTDVVKAPTAANKVLAPNYSASVNAEEGATITFGIYTKVPTAAVYAYYDNFTLSYTDYREETGPQTEAEEGVEYDNDNVKVVGLADGTVAISQLIVNDGTATIPASFEKYNSGVLTHDFKISQLGNGESVIADADISQLSTLNSLLSTPMALGNNAFTADLTQNVVVYVPKGAAANYNTPSLTYWQLFYSNNNIHERDTLTMTTAGYATYYNDYAYVLPEGLTAYQITGVNNSTAVMDQVYDAGDNVYAGYALLFKGNSGTYYVDLYASGGLTEDKGSFDSNVLRGTQTEQLIDSQEGYVYYQFADDETDGLGWYWGAADGAAFTNKAKKSYLPVLKTVASKGAIRMDFTTAVSKVSANNSKVTPANGKFLKNGQLYIIKDGKKYTIAGQQM